MASRNTIIKKEIIPLIKRYPIINWLETHRALQDITRDLSKWKPYGERLFSKKNSEKDPIKQGFQFRYYGTGLLKFILLYGLDLPRREISGEKIETDYLNLIAIVVNEIFNKSEPLIDTTEPFDIMALLMPSFTTCAQVQLNRDELSRTGSFLLKFFINHSQELGLNKERVTRHFQLFSLLTSLSASPNSFNLRAIADPTPTPEEIDALCLNSTQWKNLYNQLNLTKQLDNPFFTVEPFHQYPFFLANDGSSILSSVDNLGCYYSQGVFFYFETYFKDTFIKSEVGPIFEQKCRDIIKAHIRSLSEPIAFFEEKDIENFQIRKSKQLARPDMVITGHNGVCIALEFTTTLLYRKARLPETQAELEEALKEKMLPKLKQVYGHLVSVNNGLYKDEYSSQVRTYIPIFVTMNQEIPINSKIFWESTMTRLMRAEYGNEEMLESLQKIKYLALSVSEMDLLFVAIKELGWEVVSRILTDIQEQQEDSNKLLGYLEEALQKKSQTLYELAKSTTHLFLS